MRHALGLLLFTSALTAQAGAILEVGGAARVARLVSLYVRAGTPPTPFTAPGPFTARWRGTLDVPLRDRFTFHAEGNGTFALEVGGAAIELDKATRLNKGKQAFTLTWTSPQEGDAFVRLHWSCAEWAMEPISPKLLAHDPNDPALQRGTALREGRQLFAEANCAMCHEPATAFEHRSAMPELAFGGPSLSDVTARLRVPWIAKWILDPGALRTTPRMPKLTHSEADARDIAAFLHAFGGKPADEPETPPGPELVEKGGRIFATLGCIGCHARPDDPANQDMSRFAGAKYRPSALIAFLKDPGANHASTRMPDFALSDQEAEALAAYLRAKGAAPFPEFSEKPDAQRGRERLQELGCSKCHFGCAEFTAATPGLEKVQAKAATTACRVAEYGFTAAQQKALQAFLATDLAALRRDPPAEYAEREFAALRCNACHVRDRGQDLWTQRAGDLTTLAPQGTETVTGAARPHLTWAGEKLRPEHLHALLAGTVKARARPWLHARMPAWPLRSKALAEGLAAQHGCPPTSPEVAVVPELAAIGRKLVGADGGFTCVQCHGVGEQKATQVFEAEGINFAHVKARLREEYFHRWMQNPQRIDFATKMLKYADKDGKTPFTGILEGDARRQFGAIWEFLKTL